MSHESAVPAIDPEDLGRLFAQHVNGRRLDDLVSLYEPGATLVSPDGRHVNGALAIREYLEGLLALSPRISPIRARALVVGDLALVCHRWSMAVGLGEDGSGGFEGASTEVARRQGDGTWRYAIDDPLSETAR